MMSEKTDEEIASLIQRGKVQLFGILIQRYEQKLTRYGRKFLSGREDIQDLVQDIFIKAYMNMRSFDPKRRFSPWIYRIAHNEFVNAVKRKSRDMAFPFDLDLLLPHPIAKETSDKEVNIKDLKRLLDLCLDRLDGKYKEVLVLYYIEEMDYREISEILQIPVSTVGVRLQRGRAMMKTLVKKIDPMYEP